MLRTLRMVPRRLLVAVRRPFRDGSRAEWRCDVPGAKPAVTNPQPSAIRPRWRPSPSIRRLSARDRVSGLGGSRTEPRSPVSHQPPRVRQRSPDGPRASIKSSTNEPATAAGSSSWVNRVWSAPAFMTCESIHSAMRSRPGRRYVSFVRKDARARITARETDESGSGRSLTTGRGSSLRVPTIRLAVADPLAWA